MYNRVVMKGNVSSKRCPSPIRYVYCLNCHHTHIFGEKIQQYSLFHSEYLVPIRCEQDMGFYQNYRYNSPSFHLLSRNSTCTIKLCKVFTQEMWKSDHMSLANLPEVANQICATTTCSSLADPWGPPLFSLSTPVQTTVWFMCRD